MIDPIGIGKAFEAVFFGVESGIEKNGNAVHFQEIRIGPNLLPPAEDRESPAHSFLTRW
jgi:hypothetical protein